MIKLNIQYFAAAGDLVNATSTYINSATGATDAFDTVNTLAPGMKTFWDTVALVNARDNLCFAQLGDKQTLPANQGLIVEWQKWNTLPDADTLVEGVIPAGKKFGESVVTTTLTEMGLYVATTKKLQLHHNRDVVLGITTEVGASIGRSYEKLIRSALLEGTNVLYADAINTTSSNVYVSTPSARHLLSNAAATWCGISLDMIAQVVTRLEAANAPTFDGMNYVSVIHPYIAKDIRALSGWQEYHKYAAVKELFTNELGELNGVRFIKSTLAPIIRGADLSAAARTLTVDAYTAGTNTVTLKETLSAADVTALSGRELIIGGLHFSVKSATTTTIVLDDIGAAAAEAASNPPAQNDVIYPGEGGAAGISIFPCLFFGADAFKIVDPEGAGIETIIKTPEQIGGPLNQFSTVGAKFEGAAKIVYPDRLVSLECVSSYSATAAAN